MASLKGVQKHHYDHVILISIHYPADRYAGKVNVTIILISAIIIIIFSIIIIIIGIGIFSIIILMSKLVFLKDMNMARVSVVEKKCLSEFCLVLTSQLYRSGGYPLQQQSFREVVILPLLYTFAVECAAPQDLKCQPSQYWL